MRLVARWMLDLPRKSIPSELEGSVVATLHGGYREDRAVSAMRELARLSPPAELSHAVREVVGGEDRAPAILDRLLAEEIEDSGRSAARRASARLRRFPAPPELALRLQEQFQHPETSKRPALLRRGVVALGLAASALLAMKLGGVFGELVPRERGRPIATIEFHGAGSLAELEPLARDLLDQFTGGASFAVPR